MTTQKGTATELGTLPIRKLLMQYSIPAIIAMTAASLYNMIDSIYIGQGVGALAISGLALTFPLMNLAAAFGSLVGVGAATLISVRLGQKDYDTAKDILGNVVLLNLIIGLAFGFITLIFLDPILYFFGASEDMLAVTYLTFGTPSSGTLYKNWTGVTGTKVTTSDKFAYVSSISGYTSLGTVTYVPAAGYSGTVTIPFSAYTTGGTVISGKVSIKVTATATGSGEDARGIYARQGITVSPQAGKVIAAEEGESEAAAQALQALQAGNGGAGGLVLPVRLGIVLNAGGVGLQLGVDGVLVGLHHHPGHLVVLHHLHELGVLDLL